MPQHTHVQLARLIHLIAKAHDRFGERLIYSFVEPRQFIQRPALVPPERARPTTGSKSRRPMSLRRRIRRVESVLSSLRFLRLLFSTLLIVAVLHSANCRC